MIRAVFVPLWWWVFWHPAPATDLDATTWRVLTTRDVHVGVRPASDGTGWALTVQITIRTPW